MIYLGVSPLLINLNDLPQALNKTGSYIYADKTCIFYQDDALSSYNSLFVTDYVRI